MVYPIHTHFKNSQKFLNDLKTKPEGYWLKRGRMMALRLFKQTYKRVPAYRMFLKKEKNPLFNLLPLTNKDNYLRKYSLKELSWDGKFSEKSWVISATSGSTGEPFYFPRSVQQDLQYALTAELYLVTNFDLRKKKTLYINGFAMGVWIGGLFTYQAIKHICEKEEYPLSIINPGINKKEILKILNKFSDQFDQIIIGGYPPFVKDFIDYANKEKYDWNATRIRFIFSAEGFSELFRDYIYTHAQLKDKYRDTLNHYGTVDLGTMAYETPVAILIRRLALKNKEFHKKLFGVSDRLPTLAQYVPEQFYFEEVDGALVCTSASGLPLVKYNLKDIGGIKKWGEVVSLAKECGINLASEIKKVKISDTLWKLPFVYVFEREDFSVSFYGANIYPEHIKSILFNSKFKKRITGNFTLKITYTKKQEPVLTIHIEKQKGGRLSKAFHKEIQELVFNKFLQVNTEFKNNFEKLGNKVIPKIVFWEYEHTKYFNRQGKQKWVSK